MTAVKMSLINGVTTYLKKILPPGNGKSAVEAYNAWSDSYDDQPGNLMLDLDEQLFTTLVKPLELENKKIVDIGCGTGRHWSKLYALQPSLIAGFDVSVGMLEKLKQKFPMAMTQHSTDNLLKMVPDAFADCILTTLTIAHIKHIDEAITAWSRILKNDGDLIITDFHPAILAKGGQRSFRHQDKTISVINYVHPLKTVIETFRRNDLTVVQLEEKYLTEEIKHYYLAKNALHVYERFKGMPVIYGLHLKKKHGTA